MDNIYVTGKLDNNWEYKDIYNNVFIRPFYVKHDRALINDDLTMQIYTVFTRSIIWLRATPIRTSTC